MGKSGLRAGSGYVCCYNSAMNNQTFEDAINDIRKTVSRFQKIEGKPWRVEGAVIELAKQVGQLSALVMNREGYYYAEREKEMTAINHPTITLPMSWQILCSQLFVSPTTME